MTIAIEYTNADFAIPNENKLYAHAVKTWKHKQAKLKRKR
jgi:hypothetical protein